MAEDIFFWIGQTIGAGIALIVLIAVFTVLFTGFKSNPQVSTNPYAVNALTQGQTAIGVFPNAAVIVFMVMAFAALMASFFADTVIVFAIVEFIILPIEMFVAFIAHDLFFQIIASPFLASTAAQFPVYITFFAYLAPIVLIFAVLNAIVLYAKPGRPQQ